MKTITPHLIAAFAATSGVLSAATTVPDDSSEGLAKKLSNPIAALITAPFQNNFLYGVGPGNGFRETTNFQPVIPFSLNEDWNVISRTILPVTYQDGVFPGTGHQFGLGDTVQSFFFSPKSTEPFIWGFGPVFLLPTATDELLGAEQWGTGPTCVILKQFGPWTCGMLSNHIWSFAGDDGRGAVNTTLLQPFLSYTTKSATTFYINTESTYDWYARQWTVPINSGVSQLLKFGDQPVSIGLSGTWYAERPDTAPEWGIRFTVSFLFPRS